MLRSLAGQANVHREASRNRIREDESGRSDRGDRPTTDESEELCRLRWENGELKRTNDILKAASAFSRPDSTSIRWQ
ncbi:hypothetical protein ACRAKI_21420 [Saccharothrix isguenensis]